VGENACVFEKSGLVGDRAETATPVVLGLDLQAVNPFGHSFEGSSSAPDLEVAGTSASRSPSH